MAHRFRSGPVWETNPVRTLAAACAWMACALAAAGCASSNSLTGPTDRTTLAAGSWGGQHVGLTVTAAATTIEFDCAHGRIEGAIPLDARGRFDVSGTFVLEHGGPARPDEWQHAARTLRGIDGRFRHGLDRDDHGADWGCWYLQPRAWPDWSFCQMLVMVSTVLRVNPAPPPAGGW